MREVAKSIVGFSWAVSLFSVQQLAKLISPSPAEGLDQAAREFDVVSRVVQSHLADSVAQQFRAGDEWQRRVIDAMFDAATMQSLDPRPMVRTGTDLLQRSMDTIRQTVTPSRTTPDVPAVL